MSFVSSRLTTEQLRGLYQGKYVTHHLNQPIYRISRLLPYLKLRKTDIVADFGCGNGILLHVIHDRIARYLGVDWSEEFIAVAKSRCEAMNIDNALFECADITDFCHRNKASFDKAFTMDLSEHIYDEDFVPIYTAIWQSLKPGGTLYLHTPNATYLLEILKRKGIMRQFPEHVAVRNADENIQLLAKAGFSSVTVHYLSHYVRPLSSLHFLSRIPVVGRLFQARLLIECVK
jgi:2-polyprenyl-6-hydroxyphenyl methylase/3-demethylubiquinone-9 3-methyltransferase